jgi:uncharacterized protein (DUF736 family)
MTKQQYDNTNRGALFKIEDKHSEEHADYRGELNANGVDFWVDGWLKTSKKGTRFISFRLKPKAATTPPTGGSKPFNDDLDIPF